MSIRHTVLVAALLSCAIPLSAQWTNRYQRIGQGHHVYVEGYDFPTYSVGPTYPAISPDGSTVAFSARGWLWTMPLAGGTATRLTNQRGMDSRPAWHPDGRRIAFVRDDTRNTDIILIDLASGTETMLVEGPAAELDPAFTQDGTALYYASGDGGDMEIYRLELASGVKTRVTDSRGLDLRPQPLANGGVVFISKRGTGDELATLDAKGQRRVLAVASIASLARPAVSADGNRIAVPLPIGSRTEWALQVLDAGGGPLTEIVSGGGHPIMPAWTPSGDLLFSRADANGVFGLWRIPASGGEARMVTPTGWDWKVPTATLSVRTTADGAPAPSRLHVVDGDGHPAFALAHQSWLDGQSGMVFTYSPGLLEFQIPAGAYRVVAARGFEYAVAEASGPAQSGATALASLDLPRLGGASLDGWYSGDHHFHLNYGGQALLHPQALVAMMQGEDLDVATPLSANLHTRRIDENYFAWTRHEPLIQFGQEVRSHFLGHTGHIGVKRLYWPWYWGPGYPVYGRDDRSNVGALQHTRKQAGVNSYVHPVTNRTPFGGDAPRGVPLELVSDAVLGDVDTIELACLWSDELGTAEAWYRLLNVGARVTPSAGTDAMVDFFRTMAIGTTRVYVNVPAPLTMERYLEGLKAGRSFVTTGPLLRFLVADRGPGEVVQGAASGELPWELHVATAVPFDQVEILVNGEVVWKGTGLKEPGAATHRGSIRVPSGGWIAARVHGGTTAWPGMDSYPFAHTAPVWIREAGSTDPVAAARAAKDLLAALDVAEGRIRESYEGTATPELLGRLAKAREKLASLGQLPTPKLPTPKLPTPKLPTPKLPTPKRRSWELVVGSWALGVVPLQSIPMSSLLSDTTRDLPAPVAQVIAELVEGAAGALGDTLRSIVLFGSAAENRLRPTSDLNVLVVVTRFDAARVDQLTAVLQRGHAAVRLAVMWLLEDEIRWASESFAVKFADIARRRRILFGTDPFAGLTISRQAAITRVRQVLLNLVLRLRASYARDGGHEERIAILLADAAGPLRASAAEILELQGRPAATARDALDLLAAEWSASRGAAVTQSIRTARETRRLEPGTARAALLEVIDLVGHFSGRAFDLT